MSDAVQIQGSLGALRGAFARDVAEAKTPQALEQLRIKFLGRKSSLATYLKQLSSLSPDQRAVVGKELNLLKSELEQQLAEAQRQLQAQPALAHLDVTLPGIAPPVGRLHPVTQTFQAIVGCFVPMGFEIVEGPELEHEFYNFDALNIPSDHPSREAFDTFFVDLPALSAVPGTGQAGAPNVGQVGAAQAGAPRDRRNLGRLLLRSHTSPVQIRVMQRRHPPLRILVPGKVFRPDPLDASHSFMFHQVEGLMVDERTSFADLKGILAQFLEQLFGPATRVRFRPHFFPFTEPSAEVDIACRSCEGAGCPTCGRKGWVEIMGWGMVHPTVFKAVGYDAQRVQGFAFGMGVERIAMLKHGIRDIRLFFENDLRFLEQF